MFTFYKVKKSKTKRVVKTVCGIFFRPLYTNAFQISSVYELKLRDIRTINIFRDKLQFRRNNLKFIFLTSLGEI